MISKVEKLVDVTPKSLIFDNCEIILSPTLTDKPLNFHFSYGDLNTKNSVFKWFFDMTKECKTRDESFPTL